MVNKKAYVNMHIAILLWGFTGILGRAINMPFSDIVWYRMIISSIGLFAILIFTKKFSLPSVRDFIDIAAVGIIVMLHWLAFYAAIKKSNVSVTLSCFASISLFTALFDPIINKRKLDKVEILLSLFGIVGIYIIFTAQQFYLWGILLSLLSAALGSVFTIYNKRLLQKFEPEVLTLYELFAGWLGLCLVSFIIPSYFKLTFVIPSILDFIYLLILSIVCTTIAFTISLKALKYLDAFILNLSVNLEPVYSIVLAILIFKENKFLNIGFYIGTFIILVSVFIHAWHQNSVLKKIQTDN